MLVLSTQPSIRQMLLVLGIPWDECLALLLTVKLDSCNNLIIHSSINCNHTAVEIKQIIITFILHCSLRTLHFKYYCSFFMAIWVIISRLVNPIFKSLDLPSFGNVFTWNDKFMNMHHVLYCIWNCNMV